MGKMKKSVKKFLSMLLALALVVTGIRWFDSGAEVKAATSGYTELTFKDWGIKNGEYRNETKYSLLDTTITSLDKVAFTGKLTFNESNSFRIGGKDGWAGLTFMINSNGYLCFSDESDSDSGDEAAADNIVLSKTDAFTLRLTFDRDAEENLWTVGIYVNGSHVADFTDTMNLGTGLLVWGEDMILEDVIYGEDATYKELTFSDWGITDGTCGDSKAYALTDKVITSLDGVAFTGKITYNTASNFRIGGGADGWTGLYFSIQDSGKLHVSDQTGGSGAWKILEGTKLSKSEQFELRLTFDQDDATQKWTVRIYVNGVHQTNFTAAMNLGTAFLVEGAGMTVEDVDKKPSYKELTFRDWGIQNGEYLNKNGYTLTDTSITSLDKTAFNGVIMYNDASFRIGGNSNVWAGLLFSISNGYLYVSDESDNVGGDDVTLSETQLSKTEAFTLRLTFDKGTNADEWTVGIYVNGIHEYDFTDTMNLGTALLIDGDGMVLKDVLSEDEEEPPLEQLPSDFMTITPNDFGIADGENSPSGFGIKKLAFNGDASLDRKILNMNVTVDGADIQMFYGCKTVGDQKNGLLFRFEANDSRITIIDKAGYGNVVGTLSGSVGNFDFSEKQYVNLKITTEFINADEGDTADDLRLGVFVNEVLYNNQYFVINDYKNSMDATLSLGTYLDGNAKLVISTPKNYMPDTFRHLTFIDVGYGREELGYDQAGASSTEIDWDKLLFSGKIQLNSVGSEIRFGAKEGGWVGYRLEMTDSGLTLIWDDGTNRTNVFTYPTIKEGTLFTFTLATEYVDIDGDGQKNDLKFGFWIDGKMHANRWFYHQNYQLNGAEDTSLTFCMDHKNNNSSCVLISWKPNTNVENLNSGKQIFNIAEGGYLLASNGKIVVNDEEKATGTVLNTAGDYKVSIEEGNSTKNSTVILWEAGETHLDGKQTVQDLVAIIKAANGSEVSTEAAKKGADVTGDGKIDTSDVSLMREALVGAKTLENKDASNVSYLAGNNVMPIGGFWGPTTGTLSDEVFKNIKESGINLITWSIDTYGADIDAQNQNVEQQLTLADQYGLSLFIRDGRVNALTNPTDTEIAGKVADYSKYNSFRGLTIVDEPRNKDYGTSDAYLSTYANVSAKLNTYVNMNAYVNLYPIDSNQGEETDYESYVDEYCKNYNPKFLSYDDYPFNNNTVKNCSNYFKNLSIIRNKAAEYKIPFWSFVQVGAWGSKKTITEAQMKWNLNMNLAFGAQGIQYFPMVEPTDDASFDGKGMFTEAGATTEYYGYVQKLNQWVATVDDILMNSESKGIITTGYYANKNIKDNGVATVDNYGKIASVKTNETGIANGAVVGCFDYNGKTVAYVVNYDASKSHTITLKYSESTSYRLLKSDGESDMTGSSCAISLGAGEAALVVID